MLVEGWEPSSQSVLVVLCCTGAGDVQEHVTVFVIPAHVLLPTQAEWPAVS